MLWEPVRVRRGTRRGINFGYRAEEEEPVIRVREAKEGTERIMGEL